MTDPTAQTMALWETTAAELWDVIAQIRDASPRLKNDADTDDILDAIAPVIDAYVAQYVAQELRDLAEAVVGEEDGNKMWRAIVQHARRFDATEETQT